MIELAGFRKQDSTIDDAKDLYNRSHRGFQEQSAITWAMECDGQLVGTIGFYRGFENETGEVGYIMKQAFQRRGFMSEALEAVTRFGFEAMQLQRITAYTDINNRASVSLLVKHHFTNTGTTKDEYTIFELKGL